MLHRPLIQVCFCCAAMSFVMAEAPKSDEEEDFVTFSLEFQGCETYEHALLWDEAARKAFTDCDEPLAGFNAYLIPYDELGKIGITDENGNVKLGPVRAKRGTRIQLAVCEEDGGRCLNLKNGRAGERWASHGQHYILYLNGRASHDEEGL